MRRRLAQTMTQQELASAITPHNNWQPKDQKVAAPAAEAIGRRGSPWWTDPAATPAPAAACGTGARNRHGRAGAGFAAALRGSRRRARCCRSLGRRRTCSNTACPIGAWATAAPELSINTPTGTIPGGNRAKYRP